MTNTFRRRMKTSFWLEYRALKQPRSLLYIMILFSYYSVKCSTLILHFSNKKAWSPAKMLLLKYSDNAHHTELCIINSPLNLSLSQQENTQTWGAARFKPSARFIHVKTKRYMPYHRNVIYNPSNIQLQKTRSQAKLN